MRASLPGWPPGICIDMLSPRPLQKRAPVHRGFGGEGRGGRGRRGERVGFGTGGAVLLRTQPSRFWRDPRFLIAASR